MVSSGGVYVYIFFFWSEDRQPQNQDPKAPLSARSQPDAPSTKVGTLQVRSLGTLELPPGEAAGPLPRHLVSIRALRKVVGGCSRCGVGPGQVCRPLGELLPTPVCQ